MRGSLRRHSRTRSGRRRPRPPPRRDRPRAGPAASGPASRSSSYQARLVAATSGVDARRPGPRQREPGEERGAVLAVDRRVRIGQRRPWRAAASRPPARPGRPSTPVASAERRQEGREPALELVELRRRRRPVEHGGHEPVAEDRPQRRVDRLELQLAKRVLERGHRRARRGGPRGAPTARRCRRGSRGTPRRRGTRRPRARRGGRAPRARGTSAATRGRSGRRGTPRTRSRRSAGPGPPRASVGRAAWPARRLADVRRRVPDPAARSAANRSW